MNCEVLQILFGDFQIECNKIYSNKMNAWIEENNQKHKRMRKKYYTLNLWILKDKEKQMRAVI